MSKALTALACERHQSGTLPDSRCPGLRLEATSSQKRSWIYRYRLPSRGLRQMKLGEFPRMTLAEARAAWSEQKKIRDRSLDPRVEKEKAIQAELATVRAAYSVDEMVADWVRLHATNLVRSDEMERLLTREVLPKWKGRPAASVARRDCVDLFESVNGRAPRVAEQMMSTVRGAFKLAIERGRLDVANPAAGVGSMKHRERTRAFSDQELKAFLPWLAHAKLSVSVRDVMRITLLTACRSGEACSAEWSEVDLEAGVWTQPNSKTKNGRVHRVMLSPQVIAIFKGRAQNGSRWIFPSRNDKPILQKAVGFAQYGARELCPLKNWTVHDLRRTALTGLARLRCPRVVQDRIANHTDRSIAAIYDRHSYDDEAQMWLQSWANRLDQLAVEVPAESVRSELVSAEV